MRYIRFACAFLPAGTSVCMTACGDELSFEEGVDCFSKRYGGLSSRTIKFMPNKNVIGKNLLASVGRFLFGMTWTNFPKKIDNFFYLCYTDTIIY